ncbi:hypothetical protein BGW80DRAFT_1448811 [Lactifluus volemus]|nr:hypothetical protein BGW80DRAFT_1448811 [Lactifluus volemus]
MPSQPHPGTNVTHLTKIQARKLSQSRKLAKLGVLSSGKFRQIRPNGISRGRNGVRCGRADGDFPRFSQRRGLPPTGGLDVTIPRVPYPSSTPSLCIGITIAVESPLCEDGIISLSFASYIGIRFAGSVWILVLETVVCALRLSSERVQGCQGGEGVVNGSLYKSGSLAWASRYLEGTRWMMLVGQLVICHGGVENSTDHVDGLMVASLQGQEWKTGMVSSMVTGMMFRGLKPTVLHAIGRATDDTGLSGTNNPTQIAPQKARPPGHYAFMSPNWSGVLRRGNFEGLGAVDSLGLWAQHTVQYPPFYDRPLYIFNKLFICRHEHSLPICRDYHDCKKSWIKKRKAYSRSETPPFMQQVALTAQIGVSRDRLSAFTSAVCQGYYEQTPPLPQPQGHLATTLGQALLMLHSWPGVILRGNLVDTTNPFFQHIVGISLPTADVRTSPVPQGDRWLTLQHPTPRTHRAAPNDPPCQPTTFSCHNTLGDTQERMD